MINGLRCSHRQGFDAIIQDATCINQTNSYTLNSHGYKCCSYIRYFTVIRINIHQSILHCIARTDQKQSATFSIYNDWRFDCSVNISFWSITMKHQSSASLAFCEGQPPVIGEEVIHPCPNIKGGFRVWRPYPPPPTTPTPHPHPHPPTTIYVTITVARWRLKPPASRLFTQASIQT